jgi:hypothetical protein
LNDKKKARDQFFEVQCGSLADFAYISVPMLKVEKSKKKTLSVQSHQILVIL